MNQTETSVLADLEGLEGRRQEQVSDIVTKFEDRFKHHMVDLLFLEKLGRWLTNTQVRNSQYFRVLAMFVESTTTTLHYLDTNPPQKKPTQPHQ